MKMPKKWERGEMVRSYREFEISVRAKRMLYVKGFFHGRPTSAVVVANMSYSLVTALIVGGNINLASQCEGYREWLREELLGPEPEAFLRLAPTEEGWEIVD